MEEGVRLALETGRRVGEEYHAWLKDEEEARLTEKSRLKYEENDLWLKAEDEVSLVEEARLKSGQEGQASLYS